jgi:hypothetical protein
MNKHFEIDNFSLPHKNWQFHFSVNIKSGAGKAAVILQQARP